MLERATDGWAVPHANTRARRVYDMLRKGYGPRAIANTVGLTSGTVRVMIYRIRNPDSRKGKP